VTRNDDPILVVGGGLGGASISLALARKGFRVRLLEQAPEFGVIGYGIQLGPNVFPMFDRLGVADAVLAQAIVPDALRMIDSVDAGLIMKIPTGASFQQRFKRPYILIHRVDLHRILLDACEKEANVELIARGPIVWINRRLYHYTGIAKRIFYPPSDVGPAGVSWLVAFPLLFMRFPEKTRLAIDTRSVRPSVAPWIRPRVEGRRQAAGRRVALQLKGPS